MKKIVPFLLALLIGGIGFGTLPWAFGWLFTDGPHFVMPYGEKYGSLDFFTYSAQYVEIANGGSSAGNVHLSDGQERPSAPWMPLPFSVFGMAIRFLGLNGGIALVWFLAWSATFLFVFLLAGRIVKSTSLQVVITILVLGAEGFIRNPLKILADPFVYSPRHGVEYAVLFASIWALVWALENGGFNRFVVAGLVGGLNFSTYIYHALLFMGIVGFIALSSMSWKRFGQISLIGLVAGIMALPFVLAKRAFDSFPEAADWYLRAGLKHSYLPEFLHTAILLVGLFIFIFWFMDGTWFADTIAASLMVSILLLNMQVVTGWSAQAGHWFLRSGRMLLMLGFCFSFRYVMRWRSRTWVRPLLCSLTIVLLFGSQLVDGYRKAEVWTLPQDYVDAVKWIRENEPEAVVVSIAPRVNGMVAAIGGNKLLMVQGLVNHNSELESNLRAIQTFKYYGANADDFIRFINSSSVRDGDDRAGNEYLWGVKWVYAFEVLDDVPPAEELEKLRKLYEQETLNYKADLLIFGPLERLLVPSAKVIQGKIVKKIGSVEIIQLQRKI